MSHTNARELKKFELQIIFYNNPSIWITYDQ